MGQAASHIYGGYSYDLQQITLFLRAAQRYACISSEFIKVRKFLEGGQSTSSAVIHPLVCGIPLVYQSLEQRWSE